MPSNSLKDALALAPMDLCRFPHRSPSRTWWREGWAVGFLGRSRPDYLASVRSQRFRLAFSVGFDIGAKAREDFTGGSLGV